MRQPTKGFLSRHRRFGMHLAWVFVGLFAPLALAAPPHPAIGDTMTEKQVAAFAKLALSGIDREFPNKPSNVMTTRDSVRSPKELHPVFFGHFDWHSSVHGHWMLIRLLKTYPHSPTAPTIAQRLDARLSKEGLLAEAAYFDDKENRSFERMYGWAWALRLATELHAWDHAMGKKWAASYKPLEDRIVQLAKAYLPKLDWPIRCGFHPESAFALSQFLDYARTVGDHEFETLILAKSRTFYQNDQNYPAAYEPSGNDFFSAGLNEADLMRRVLDPKIYGIWLDQFFPGLASGKCGNLLVPVNVSDVTDGHLVHLAGLNLTRAWTMNGIAKALIDDQDPRRSVLQGAAAKHAEAGLSYVFTGHYEGEHWLASFAIYLLAEVGVTNVE